MLLVVPLERADAVTVADAEPAQRDGEPTGAFGDLGERRASDAVALEGGDLTATPPSASSGWTASPRKIAVRTTADTASSVMTTEVREAPSRPIATKNSVNAVAVATPLASNGGRLGPSARNWPDATPTTSIPTVAPIAVHAAAVSASVRCSRRGLASAEHRKHATEPIANAMPTGAIDTLPPPTATPTAPAVDSVIAANTDRCGAIARSRSSTAVTTAGYT